MVLYLKIVKNKYVYNVYNSYFINKYLCFQKNYVYSCFQKKYMYIRHRKTKN